MIDTPIPFNRERRRVSRRATAIVTGAALALSGGIAFAASPVPAQAADAGCYDADITVQRWMDDRGVVLFVTDDDSAQAATDAGFSATGESFGASSTPQSGLVELRGAYRERTGDYAWILWTGEYEGVLSRGWESAGTIGYVSPKALPACEDQIQLTRSLKGVLHTVTADREEAAEALQNGYVPEYSWYAVPAPIVSTPAPTPTPTPAPTPTPTPPGPGTHTGDGDGSFTIAVLPDTQQEVFDWAKTRFRDRSEWLVENAQKVDLRFVAHVGDVVNWDDENHSQYVIAENALDPLEEAGIPYQLSIGNHDTLATGPGGNARDPRFTREYQRTTDTFNSYWSTEDYGAVVGEFEAGKVDNTYSIFEAEGTTWLVLNLELWPRVAVVDWAEKVITSHPNANVMIQTHSFLNGSADIDGAGASSTRWQYGDSSPQYIYDRLVAPHSNVKIVTSGHVGAAASKVITTASGNKVAYLLQSLHSNNNNPVRLNKVDVNTGTIATYVYAPEDGATWDSKTLSGLSFLRSAE